MRSDIVESLIKDSRLFSEDYVSVKPSFSNKNLRREVKDALYTYIEYCNDNNDNKHKKSIPEKVYRVKDELSFNDSIKFDKCITALQKHMLYTSQKNNEVIICPSYLKSSDSKELLSKSDFEVIMRLQKWGNYPDTDLKFYIHMVFRYYMEKINKTFIRSGYSISLSYQRVLDIMYPVNFTPSGFPEDFSIMLDSAGGDICNVKNIFVPTKSNTSIPRRDSGEHFEKDPEVQNLRAFIYNKFKSWESRSRPLYPSFLINGDKNNSIIINVFGKIYNSRKFKKDLCILEKIPLKTLDIMKSILKLNPNTIGNLHSIYSKKTFVSDYDQVDEKLEFFNLYRSDLRLITESVSNELFKIDGFHFTISKKFNTLCSNSKMTFSRMDDHSKWLLLDTIIKFIYVFYLLDQNEKNLIDLSDPKDIMLKGIKDMGYVDFISALTT